MDPRSILSMLMARGSGGGSPVGAEEYQRLLADRMGRVGYDRDEAVRSANIAGGFGNSSAQQFMHQAPAADPMQTGAVPVPTQRPESLPAEAPVPTPAMREPGIGSGIPTPSTPIQGVPIPTPRPENLPATSALLPAEAPVPTLREQPVVPSQAPRPTPRPARKGKKAKRSQYRLD